MFTGGLGEGVGGGGLKLKLIELSQSSCYIVLSPFNITPVIKMKLIFFDSWPMSKMVTKVLIET